MDSLEGLACKCPALPANCSYIGLWSWKARSGENLTEFLCKLFSCSGDGQYTEREGSCRDGGMNLSTCMLGPQYSQVRKKKPWRKRLKQLHQGKDLPILPGSLTTAEVLLACYSGFHLLPTGLWALERREELDLHQWWREYLEMVYYRGKSNLRCFGTVNHRSFLEAPSKVHALLFLPCKSAFQSLNHSHFTWRKSLKTL